MLDATYIKDLSLICLLLWREMSLLIAALLSKELYLEEQKPVVVIGSCSKQGGLIPRRGAISRK